MNFRAHLVKHIPRRLDVRMSTAISKFVSPEVRCRPRMRAVHTPKSFFKFLKVLQVQQGTFSSVPKFEWKTPRFCLTV